MASITINDLALSQALDRKAMLSLRGAFAGDWSIFAFRPFRPPVAGIVPSISYVNVTNNFTYIENLTNQITTIDIDSTGLASPVTAVVIPTLNG